MKYGRVLRTQTESLTMVVEPAMDKMSEMPCGLGEGYGYHDPTIEDAYFAPDMTKSDAAVSRVCALASG